MSSKAQNTKTGDGARESMDFGGNGRRAPAQFRQTDFKHWYTHSLVKLYRTLWFGTPTAAINNKARRLDSYRTSAVWQPPTAGPQLRWGFRQLFRQKSRKIRNRCLLSRVCFAVHGRRGHRTDTVGNSQSFFLKGFWCGPRPRLHFRSDLRSIPLSMAATYDFSEKVSLWHC